MTEPSDFWCSDGLVSPLRDALWVIREDLVSPTRQEERTACVGAASY